MNPYDLMHEVEQECCVTCRFRKNPDEEGQHAQEFPMCFEVEAEFIAEDGQPESIDEDEFGVVVCTKYRPGDPWETFGVHPDQLTLGE